MTILCLLLTYYSNSQVYGPYNPSLHILPDFEFVIIMIDMISVDLSRFIKIVPLDNFIIHCIYHTVRGALLCLFLFLADGIIDWVYED